MAYTINRKLVLITLVGLMIFARDIQADDLDISTRFSWTTAARPILHVLVKNNGDQDRKLYILVPHDLRCGGKRVPANPLHYRPFMNVTTWHDSATNGIVHPKSWLHRSYPLAREAALNYPCTATVSVNDQETYKEIYSATLQVPQESPKSLITNRGAPTVSAEAIVEQDRSFSDLLIIRVLVRNQMDQAIALYEDMRNIECTGDAQAIWPMFGGVLQGEDSGPDWVEANEWTVFVNIVRVKKLKQGKCTVSFRISSPVNSFNPRQEVARISKELIPEGYLERARQHKR